MTEVENVASVANSCMHLPWSSYKQAAVLSILARRLRIQDQLWDRMNVGGQLQGYL